MSKKQPGVNFNLRKANRQMLESQTDCDVTFTTSSGGSTDRSGKDLPKAHMFVLKARCPAMADKAESKGQNPRDYSIQLGDVKTSALCEVLRFLYTEKVHLKAYNVFGALKIAHRFGLTPLHGHCIRFIEGKITEDNVCELLKDSLELKESDDCGKKDCFGALISKCTVFIGDNAEKVIESNKFLEADQKVVNVICQLNYLGITEIKLFQRCVEWARKKENDQNLSGEKLREALGEIFNNIRFPVMKLEEYNNYIQQLNVLENKDNDNIELFIYISKGDGKSKTKSTITSFNFKTDERHQTKQAGDFERTKLQSGHNKQSTDDKEPSTLNECFNDGDTDSVWDFPRNTGLF
jgi:hypothetical protein